MQIKIEGRKIWLNFHHLFYFYTIARAGGISAASKELGIGQPALSSQLKQFESSLGVRLFDRVEKRMVLTETGKAVLQYGQDIFRMGTEMVEYIQDHSLPKRTHVHIGILDSIPKHLTLRLAQAALENFNCSLTLLEGQIETLIEDLSAHRIDVLVSNFVPPQATTSSIYSRKIASFPVLICGGPAFKKEKDLATALKNAPFILPTAQSKLRQDFEHFLQINDLPINRIIEAQDVSTQKLLALHNMGLIIASLPAVQEFIEDKRLFEIARPRELREDYYLLAASRKLTNPVSVALLKNFTLNW